MEKYLDIYEPATVLDKNGIEKTAEEKKEKVDKRVLDVVKSLKPNKDKHIYVHKVIMGDGETWGNNKNGDVFPSDDLYADTDKFGYKTFLNAGIYTSHRNKNKEKTLGKIIFSIVNPIMRRIELIEELSREKCKEHDKDFGVYDRLLDGESLLSSMGAKIQFDICSICGNRAPTRGNYCDHLLYQMNQILPDGRLVCALNPKPVFFDDSYVKNPAFSPAFTLNIIKIDADIPSLLDKHEKTAEEVVKKGKPTKVVMKTSYNGLPINVEVRSGDFRYGYARGGRWKKKMFCHYGFIPHTEGHDNEEIDVYLKPESNKNANVYIVKQVKQENGDKVFDEEKVMIGFDSKHHAKSVYLQHMGEKYFGGIEGLSMEEFKNRIKREKTSEMIKRIPSISTPILSKIKFAK